MVGLHPNLYFSACRKYVGFGGDPYYVKRFELL